MKFLPAFFALLLLSFSAHAQYFNDIELAPHNYQLRDLTDPMSALIARAEKGEHDFGNQTGLPALKKLLADLNIPVSSQVIVFSQTSLQRTLVSPQNPRAIYFTEDVHVAWMPGGKIEVTSFDPDAGGIFYFEKPPRSRNDQLSFERPETCLGCHGGSATNYLPGPLARSHFTAENGRRLRSVQTHERTGHQLPFNERWGGYFVTGAPANMEHMGNAFTTRDNGQLVIDTNTHGAKDDLREFFKSDKLLRADSNVVNLLLFDHQTEGHNLLIEARYRDRITEFRAAKNGGRPPKETLKDTNKQIDELVRYLLFADEVSLEDYALKPEPDFERDFLANKKADANGNSLKDFDLETRMFKNRCSYMIYSRSFEEAPQSMKNRVYNAMRKILMPKKAPDGYEYFDPGERERIVEILRATKSDLPKNWSE